MVVVFSVLALERAFVGGDHFLAVLGAFSADDSLVR